ncbi:unnamed protein product [Ilex paraguariensis]|uniref:non-specific serine/threonine protein kinase n=1 Tax=Ilex paraguariensis TaxID=185542 RepID=A0ABC8RYL3_9AQUA
MMLRRKAVLLWVLRLSCLLVLKVAARVPQEEVDALQQIITTMGATYWRFNAESCKVEMVGMTPQAPTGSESDVVCDRNLNNTVGHVIKIVLKRYSLPGMLPPELVKLTHLQEIDFAYNYLSGTIPLEWASTQLTLISVLANRLSGEIPKELGNITSLTYLDLEANQFSGTVPPELGKLINLKTLMLSSNRLTGKLPTTFAELRNLSNFRINDNNFSGPIPDFIQNWNQLTRLEMHASGLEGPIPSSISLLDNLTELRISDINGPVQGFPMLRGITGIVRLVLRNCNISGEIPEYVWGLRNMEMLDVSFNRLVGGIPNDIGARNLKFVFLIGNMLSGDVPTSILKDGISLDLSYNNFTWQGPEQPACRPNMNLYINLFRSSSTNNTLRDILPCMKDINCPRYGCSLHVNCGGNSLTEGKFVYEGDAAVEGGDAKYYTSSDDWGFSSGGDFMDDDNYQNTRFVATAPSTHISELYRTARVSPLSLTYVRYCMENGDYTIILHFAEILFTNDSTYNSLGRRIFDIYIQEKLVWKDFNIEDEAGGVQMPVERPFNASVTKNFLEIRFYWAGKGTTRIPNRGVYGPLISAISVNPTFKSCSNGGKKKGLLSDGTVIAVKQLSSKSRQGNREFLNEIGMISCVQHPNLVKLHGCCIEGDQLLLVYEYMENNSLASALFGELYNFATPFIPRFYHPLQMASSINVMVLDNVQVQKTVNWYWIGQQGLKSVLELLEV